MFETEDKDSAPVRTEEQKSSDLEEQLAKKFSLGCDGRCRECTRPWAIFC